jgi:hypothetical protein
MFNKGKSVMPKFAHDIYWIRRMAELHGAKYIKQFARVMWLQCGIRLVVLEAHNDMKGELCIAS